MKLPVLFSYAYRKDIPWDVLTEHADKIDLLIDSGAFTAHTQGTQQSLDDYMAWLRAIKIPFRYFVLDVIGDPVATKRNLDIMRDGRFSPIPIFTRGADPAELDQLYDRYPLVALGGVQSRAGNSPGYVKWFQEINQNRPVHWLGFTNLDFILKYKPAQVDSTTWKDVIRFGQIDLFVRGRTVRCNKNNFWKFEERIQQLGFNSSDFQNPAAWIGDHSLALSLGTAAYLRYTRQIKERTGTTVYLSVRNPYEMSVVIEQFLKLK